MPAGRAQDDEAELMKSFDAGEWDSVGEIEARREFWRAAAKAHRGARRQDVVVPLADADLDRLKEMAEKEGVPHETVAARILHRYLVNQ